MIQILKPCRIPYFGWIEFQLCIHVITRVILAICAKAKIEANSLFGLQCVVILHQGRMITMPGFNKITVEMIVYRPEANKVIRNYFWQSE